MFVLYLLQIWLLRLVRVVAVACARDVVGGAVVTSAAARCRSLAEPNSGPSSTRTHHALLLLCQRALLTFTLSRCVPLLLHGPLRPFICLSAHTHLWLHVALTEFISLTLLSVRLTYRRDSKHRRCDFHGMKHPSLQSLVFFLSPWCRSLVLFLSPVLLWCSSM